MPSSNTPMGACRKALHLRLQSGALARIGDRVDVARGAFVGQVVENIVRRLRLRPPLLVPATQNHSYFRRCILQRSAVVPVTGTVSAAVLDVTEKLQVMSPTRR